MRHEWLAEYPVVTIPLLRGTTRLSTKRSRGATASGRVTTSTGAAGRAITVGAGSATITGAAGRESITGDGSVTT
jgi:hypothetical protein